MIMLFKVNGNSFYKEVSNLYPIFPTDAFRDSSPFKSTFNQYSQHGDGDS